MRAVELAALLARDAQAVAEYLLPNGRRQGREWVCGDVEGGAGNSLKIVVDGSKAGVWKDFATDDSGDLIGLWMQARSVDLRTACSEAMKYLGIQETSNLEHPKRSWSKPSRDGVHAMQEPLLTWLKTVRKLTDRSIVAYKVASKKGALMFPYLRGGDLVAAKYRAAHEKKFWTDADCEPSLFGWQAIPSDARAVVIVEGELDALSSYEYGYPALSVPYGGGKGDKQQWIENEFERLAVYDEIFLALDGDAPGKEATQEIVRRLGRERCRIVTLPRKDMNKCLQDGIPADEIERCMRSSKTLDPDKLRPVEDYEEAVVREFERSGGTEIGVRMPWRKVGDKLLLRLGEVSLWFGINGHGKSEVVGNVILDAITQDFRVCCASLEFRPEKWLKRMVRQAAGAEIPTTNHVRHIIQALRGDMWVFACVNTASTAEMLETFRYAARRYGVMLFVIDNLAKCGIGEDDYNKQKAFVDELTAFARDYDVHVILVAHSRKPASGEDKAPEKHDAKGTGALTDMVDTVIAVWRNKPKEKRVLKGDISAVDADQEPDAVLYCHKQRNGEDEPVIRLWFDKRSHQYLEGPRLVAQPILGVRSA
jgi:twinkle protein